MALTLTTELAATLERAEIDELADLVAAAPPAVAERFGVGVVRVGGAAAVAAARADVPMLNRVLGLGLLEPATAATIARLTSPWRDAAVRYLVQVVPEAETPDLRRALEARGLVRRDNWAKVWRGAEPPLEAATDLRIEPIGPAWRSAYAEVMRAAFGLAPEHAAFFEGVVGRDGWLTYLAFDGEQPVAAAALFVHDGVGALAGGATLPSHRRHGAQGALMARRIRDGLALGCRGFMAEAQEDTPEAPNPSYRNMLRSGFQLAYLRRNYVYFPEGAG
jgi:hypothetical protein